MRCYYFHSVLAADPATYNQTKGLFFIHHYFVPAAFFCLEKRVIGKGNKIIVSFDLWMGSAGYPYADGKTFFVFEAFELMAPDGQPHPLGLCKSPLH